MGRMIDIYRSRYHNDYLHEMSLLDAEAQCGSNEARDALIRLAHCRVYMPDEIQALNWYIQSGRWKMPDDTGKMINVAEKNIKILLPMVPHKVMAKINWLLPLEEGYYKAGLSFVDNDQYEGGATIWVLKFDEAEGFRPLFCTLEYPSWTSDGSEGGQDAKSV